MVRDYRPHWQPDVVKARMGHKSYRVSLPGSAGIRRCHADHMVDGPISENQN